jgi:RNA polymerase sigma-70 factor (ECF subfamily)
MGSDNPTAATTEHTVSFTTTSWTLVLTAGEIDSPAAFQALERLCRLYAYPLYVYVRRQGHSPEDAQDLTQEFFARLLARHDLASVRREKGRFRSWLLASMNHFLVNEWKHANRLKRGGGGQLIPLNQAERRFSDEPACEVTPERLYERRWALTVLETTLQRLRSEQEALGKRELFEALEPFLAGDEVREHAAELGERLGMSAGAVRVAIHRLRKRYRELLREQITDTVAEPGEVDEELRHLFEVLG